MQFTSPKMTFFKYFYPVTIAELAQIYDSYIPGKLTLVTGAGHGIGRELALQLSALGARLVLWDINKVGLP